MKSTPSSKIKTLLILILLAAFPPLSTAMYLPALPTLTKVWGCTEAAINLTLVGFFVSFSLALLVHGPLSDRYGRKPVLMAGISLYILACLVCYLSNGPNMLVAGRILQGFGAAAAATLALAMTKDCFDGAERERAMAHMAVIGSLAPMLAPVLGGIMLSFASWTAIFLSQAALGVVSMWGVWKLKEPSPATTRTLKEVFGSYLRLMCNLRFMTLCLLVALGMTPLFCFTGGSSFIFISHFGLSEQAYSFFFAFNAAALMLGFWICGLLLKHTSGFRIIMMGYIGIFVGAMVLAFCANLGPWGMALPMGFLTMSLGISRPPSNNFLLEQVKSDAGSAASLIMFTMFVSGAAAVWFIALPWDNKILTLAMVGVAASVLVLILLPWLGRSPQA
ncbi:MAG: multidrug effflux MFS transporter [Desulfovibrionales bacterium]|nr:multidrug effflux MFS transporter [Desulfovibrionales bacterium]